MRTASAILLCLALAGCGERKAASMVATDAKPVGAEIGGTVVQFADCRDWKRGSREEKLATVRALRGQLTPQRSESAASPFPDEKAFEMFERMCALDYTQRFRLYKQYVKAQGFYPLSQ